MYKSYTVNAYATVSGISFHIFLQLIDWLTDWLTCRGRRRASDQKADIIDIRLDMHDCLRPIHAR